MEEEEDEIEGYLGLLRFAPLGFAPNFLPFHRRDKELKKSSENFLHSLKVVHGFI